jgi:hypothetical protein
VLSVLYPSKAAQVQARRAPHPLLGNRRLGASILVELSTTALMSDAVSSICAAVPPTFTSLVELPTFNEKFTVRLRRR